MREYFSPAIVLHREPRGEFDMMVSLFTERYGKIFARAKSARKITSKNSAHLLPGKLTEVRVVEQKGIQVVEALASGAVAVRPFDLYSLHTILPEWEREPALWELLTKRTFSWPTALQILGWAGEVNHCAQCGKPTASMFYARTQEFFCETCGALRRGMKPEEYIVFHER